MAYPNESHVADWQALFTALIPTIRDDYRAHEEAEIPSMQVTIGFDPETGAWNYQTGDNSFTGGAYGFPHWAVLDIDRESDPLEIAFLAESEIRELMWDCVE